MTDAELAAEKRLAQEKVAAAEVPRAGAVRVGSSTAVNPAFVLMAWLAVGAPLAWGIYRTTQSVAKFFQYA